MDEKIQRKWRKKCELDKEKLFEYSYKNNENEKWWNWIIMNEPLNQYNE